MPGPGDRAASDLVPDPRSRRTHRDWITDKEHEAVHALSRSAHQLRNSSWAEPSRSTRFDPGRDTPSARGTVCKTVAAGCAGRLLVSAPHQPYGDVAQPAGRDAGSIEGAGSTPASPPAPPLALVAQGAQRRRAKPETRGSSPLGGPGCSPLRVTSRRTGSGWSESPRPRPTSRRGS